MAPVQLAPGVTLTEANGVFSIAIDESLAVGGGKTAGVLKIAGKGEADLDAGMLVDVGLQAAAAKYPSLAAGILTLQALFDAEKAKL